MPTSHVIARFAIALVFVSFVAVPLFAFTQYGFGFGLGIGSVVPMGHEWITRLAAIELLGYEPGTVPDCAPNIRFCDPNDPRKSWERGLARNTDLSAPGAQAEKARIKSQGWAENEYASRYKPVYDAIVGQRWVDIAGYNALTSQECWTSVAQEAYDAQFDHFMRRWSDRDAEGGVVAATSSRDRFINYFVAAAMAPPTTMAVYDGGATASTSVEVDRNYFLFGRALHLFQDSFSPDHVVRNDDDKDNYVTVREVLSYLCAPGSEQHTHSKSEVIDYTAGDVIWRPGTRLQAGWVGYKASNMKVQPLVATEATKDLWAAFIRTMGTPRAQREGVARAEANTLANNWLGFNESNMRKWYDNRDHRGPTFVRPTSEDPGGADVKQCMMKLKLGTDDPATRARQLVESRRVCLYNAVPWVGYADLADPSMDIWFSWRWRNGPLKPLLPPPANWQPPRLPADSGIRVRIKSILNGQHLTAARLADEEFIYAKPGEPIDFILVRMDPDVDARRDGAYRATFAPSIFLSYDTPGRIKFYNPYKAGAPLSPTNWLTAPAPNGWSIMNHFWKRYIWLDGEWPWLTWRGSPGERHSQWAIEGLQ